MIQRAKNIYVLGVYLGHDMGACLLRDGQIVVMIEEERLNRYKHGRPNRLAGLWSEFAGRFGYFPWASVRYCLNTVGIGIDDLSLMAVGDDIWGSGLVDTLADVVPIKDPSKLVFMREPAGAAHHFHHGLTAFFGSSFEQAAVLVVDGDGSVDESGYEAETGFMFHDRKGAYDQVFKNRYDDPHIPRSGLGWTYEHVTLLLGFGTKELFVADAGKTMGLSSYGRQDPGLRESWFECDGYKIDFSGFHNWLEAHGYAEELTDFRHKLMKVRMEQPEWARNIAHKLQVELEEAMLQLARSLHRETGAENLCMAGGVALNSVANTRIARETPFKSLYVQPACYDGGQSMGLAFHGHLMLAEREDLNTIAPVTHAYYGRTYDEDVIKSALDPFCLGSETLPDAESLCEDAAAELANGKIVGWFQGGSEIGPRALGHRSILTHPGLDYMKDHLNAKVKFREGFRPFAPSALAHRSAEIFDIKGDSPFMLQVVDVHADWRDRLPAITHIDGTARLQTVHEETSPLYHSLISAFDAATGVPLVLNTSFNLRGMPIVETPRDAIECFLLTEIDVLYIGQTKITRPGPDLLVPSWHPRVMAETARDTVTHVLSLRLESQSGGLRHTEPMDDNLEKLPAMFDGARSLGDIMRDLKLKADDCTKATVLVQALLRLGALDLQIGETKISMNTETEHWWQMPRAKVLAWAERGQSNV